MTLLKIVDKTSFMGQTKNNCVITSHNHNSKLTQIIIQINIIAYSLVIMFANFVQWNLF